MKLVRKIAIALSFLFIASSALAHVVSFEPQAKEQHPQKLAGTDADWTFENPRVLDNIWGSKAIFGWLDADDVDIYEFSLSAIGFPASVLSVMALTPACNQTKNNYVNVAIIGPMGPLGQMGPSGQIITEGVPFILPPTEDMDLPFDVPPGMGVAVAENPVIPGGEPRELFYEEFSNISWFLPENLTQECIEGGQPFTCDWSNTLFGMLVVPGDYKIVVWDDDGVPQDYTLAIGFVDAGYYYETPEEELTRDNAHLHTPCTAPYPGN